MFKSSADFIENGLSKLVSPDRTIDIFFSSYNNVGKYPAGELTVDDTNTKVLVSNGNLNYGISLPLAGLASFADDDYRGQAEVHKQLVTLSGCAQQETGRVVAEYLTEANTADKPLFAVVYAGLMQYKAALCDAKNLKLSRPNAVVLTLTCDCQIDEKSKAFEQAMQSNQLDDYVVVSGCGGGSDMGQILDAVLSYRNVSVVN